MGALNALLGRSQGETLTDYVFVLACTAAAIMAIVWIGDALLESLSGGAVNIL